MYRLLSRVARGLLVGLVSGVLMTGAAGAHPAAAETIPFSTLENQRGTCGDETRGGPVMEPCDRRATEGWTAISIPNLPNDFFIRSSVTGDCLGILNNDPNAGAQVDEHACVLDGSDPFQDWHTEAGIDSGFEQLANEGDGSDLVMRPAGCSDASGVLLFMGERSQCAADDWSGLS